MTRRRSRFGILFLLLVAGGTWSAADGKPPATVVVMVLEAREMGFYLPAGRPAGANPTILVAAGTRLRLEFQNLDPGVVHDLSIAGLAVSTGRVSPGERAVLEVVAAGGSSLVYRCLLHGQMMQGTILVR